MEHQVFTLVNNFAILSCSTQDLFSIATEDFLPYDYTESKAVDSRDRQTCNSSGRNVVTPNQTIFSSPQNLSILQLNDIVFKTYWMEANRYCAGLWSADIGGKREIVL